MSSRPWFLWDLDVDEAELRARLRDPDPAVRAQWQGRVMREATFDEVFSYLRLEDIVRDWAHLSRHLGRKRAYWEFLLDGWRSDGLLPAG